MSFTLENLRAFEIKFITTCYVRSRSNSSVASSGSFSKFILTFLNCAYNCKISTMF